MDDLVHIYEASSFDDAVLCRSRLEDAGIPVLPHASGNYVVSWDSVYPLPPFFFALFVRPEDAEQARAVVAEYVQETALPEEVMVAAIEEMLAQQPAVVLEEHYRLMRRKWYYPVGMGFVWVSLIWDFVGLISVPVSYIYLATHHLHARAALLTLFSYLRQLFHF
ncbi:MAG: hypothetical protein ACYC7E_18690 [Armatimonadota bacterium]